MTGTLASPTELDLDSYRVQVEARLEAFLAGKGRAARSQAFPTRAVEELRSFFAAGGKRIRPLLCACGWHAAGGGPEPAGLVSAGAALEMFHAFALIHDDVMDRSDTRRGQPTVHRCMATEFTRTHPRAEVEQLGIGAAILIGDLALTWSDELLHAVGLDPDRLAAALSLIDEMRTEVMYGQYLDLTGSARLEARTDLPLTVIRYKTAKYTVERPLQLGATLAGADKRLLDDLSAFAIPLGEAFQLRDDLLGIFGDPGETGKSRLDDLREGKYTVLVALALAAADERQEADLRATLGNQAIGETDAERAREIMTATGAAEGVERMIGERYREALDALTAAALPAPADHALRTIAHAAAWRRS
ncbi:polyprenyl synthetase family protein [Actinoallomurus acaciae]|uniref:Polyprenyl synthetase family protein n=1 Tax=Actinoallomurus acaciae TaxID=502577 RepID=A0ABV5Y9U3_9ACTN